MQSAYIKSDSYPLTTSLQTKRVQFNSVVKKFEYTPTTPQSDSESGNKDSDDDSDAFDSADSDEACGSSDED